MELETFKSSYGYYNFRMSGGKPTEEMLNYLKTNGYRWSGKNRCWYPATSEAKNVELNEKFAGEFQKRFFAAENKTFGQELFEREQRKTEWRENHGLAEQALDDDV